MTDKNNEIVDAVRERAEIENDKDHEAAKAKRWSGATIGVAAGIGIGSAALAAALLYSRGGSKGGKDASPKK